ncbi:MAG: hypothetical protein Q9220_006082 [cf. Caloplaca sp. 1 TL-2023]
MEDNKKTLPEVAESVAVDALVNISGHVQELDRNFRLISLGSFAITASNTWVAAGGAITVAIYNRGPPGVLYKYLAASIFYWLIAASIAELASAIPSAGGATVQISAAQTVSIYAVIYPSFTTKRWHVFVAYLISTWTYCFIVLYMNRALPTIEVMSGVSIIVGVLICIVVCLDNKTGYVSNGFVFLLGMLNGAFSVGTPDCITHLAEEVPRRRPSKTIPKAILIQYVFGFFSGFLYLMAVLYRINDFDAVLNSTYLFPLAEIYRQATGSSAGAVGLLFVTFTLARDNAIPFSSFFANVSKTHHNPQRAILFYGLFVTALSYIYIGSSTAFSAFVGAFVVLSTLSYTAAILPHLIHKRKNVRPGWFWMKSP